MLYKTLLKLKEKNGLTDDLKTKIDVFYAVGRITEEQYNDLMDVGKEEDETNVNQSMILEKFSFCCIIAVEGEKERE